MPLVLITGANRGLGGGLARHYLARGCTVVAAVRDPTSMMKALADEGQLESVAFDLADLTTIDAVRAQIDDRPLDVFISNAAMTGGELGQFGQFDVDRFLLACRLNAAAPMKLLEAMASPLERAKGKALMISSRLGAVPFYGYAEYFASKTALNQLVKQASIALASRNVTVAACHPGWVETEATGAMGRAPLTPDTASDLLGTLIDKLSLADAGSFFDPDGSTLPIVPQQYDVRFYSKPRDAVN